MSQLASNRKKAFESLDSAQTGYTALSKTLAPGVLPCLTPTGYEPQHGEAGKEKENNDFSTNKHDLTHGSAEPEYG
jgi:hypothetical protein